MERVTPYVSHGPTGTEFVAACTGVRSTQPFRSGVQVTHTVGMAADGSWAVEIEWPDVLGEQLTFPPAHGTWRREGGKWVPHDPSDHAQAALLVQTVPDPPEVAQRRAEAKAGALEARIAALEAAAATK